MKKAIIIIGLLTTIFTTVSSQPLEYKIPEGILYCINDDFPGFKNYVENNGDLNVSSSKGLSFVLSIGYFSTKNFKAACDLSNNKNVNLDTPNDNNLSLLHLLCYSCDYEKVKYLLKFNPDINRKTYKPELTPAQMTQFATYRFYEHQIVSNEKYTESEKIRKLLLKNKAKDFTYSPVTYENFGNIALLIFNIISTLKPNIPVELLFTSDIFDSITIHNQNMEVVNYEKMKLLLDYCGLNPEISEYSSKDTILNQIKECNSAEDLYILIAQTGNNPLGKFQWGIINGFYDNEITDKTFFKLSSADPRFTSLEYKIEDISYLICIKVHK